MEAEKAAYPLMPRPVRLRSTLRNCVAQTEKSSSLFWTYWACRADQRMIRSQNDGGYTSPELIVWVPSLEKLELTSWQFISEIMPTSSSELRRDRTQTP